MRKKVCQNPYCKETFTARQHNQRFCSGKCKDVVNAINLKKKWPVYAGDDIKRKTILLPNGVEIRNDAMGKEIAHSVHRLFG